MSNSSSNLALVLELIKHAREHGITEVTYGDLKVRFSAQAQQTGTGPVGFSQGQLYTQPVGPAPLTWGATLHVPDEE